MGDKVMAKKPERHVCKDRSSWLSMRNTGVCHVEMRGQRAYLSVCYPSPTRGVETQLVRIHHCPFCGARLGSRNKRKLPPAPTGLHHRLMQESSRP